MGAPAARGGTVGAAVTTPAFQRRQVVLLPFPFSDLSAQKLRPAVGTLSREAHARVFASLVVLLDAA